MFKENSLFQFKQSCTKKSAVLLKTRTPSLNLFQAFISPDQENVPGSSNQ